jgi:dihydrofolate reductase
VPLRLVGSEMCIRDRLNCVDEMYITHVDHVYGADTFFPEIDQNNWDTSVVFSHEVDEKNAVAFQVKHYTKK